jgi:hypothetical protein
MNDLNFVTRRDKRSLIQNRDIQYWSTNSVIEDTVFTFVLKNTNHNQISIPIPNRAAH